MKSLICVCVDYKWNIDTGALADLGKPTTVVYHKKGTEANWSDKRFKDKAQISCQNLIENNTSKSTISISWGDAFQRKRKRDFK